MTPICKPLLLGHYYKLTPNGKHYPHVYTKIFDEDGKVVYYTELPTGSVIHPLVDASCVIAGKTVSIEIGNLGSVHAEKMFKNGWITPAYNAEKKQFEIRYKESKLSASYTAVAHT